jgi:hypothetical protein
VDESVAFGAVGDIQCPRAGVCVALGFGQVSKSTPVYTLGSPP